MELPKHLEDCYFFITKGCAKGNSCPYQHSETAKNSGDTCAQWQASFCQDCPHRHPSKPKPRPQQALIVHQGKSNLAVVEKQQHKDGKPGEEAP